MKRIAPPEGEVFPAKTQLVRVSSGQLRAVIAPPVVVFVFGPNQQLTKLGEEFSHQIPLFWQFLIVTPANVAPGPSSEATVKALNWLPPSMTQEPR